MVLNDRTTVPRRQSLRDGDVRLASLPLASPRLSRLWQPDTGKGTGQSMLGKHQLNGPCHPYALVHLV